MASQTHLRAVNRALRAADLDEAGLDAPLAELLRDLGRQMDRSGPEGPSSRLVAAYLSATKDLRRAISPQSARGRSAAPPPVEVPVELPTGPRAVERSPLDKLRDKKARAS